MNPDAFRFSERSVIPALTSAVAGAGGKLLVVGGWVRDRLCGEDSNDLDLEIFGLSRDQISTLLSGFGFTPPVGRQFPVWRSNRHGIDVAYPKAGAELYAQGTETEGSLEAAFREASRHRDLTINAMGWDPTAEVLVDLWNGQRDLQARQLRAVHMDTFGSDPLRVLRVARLRAKFNAEVDAGLEELCRSLDLSELPAERVLSELRRLLCESKRPSLAFEFLDRVDQLEVFAPLAALCGVAQDSLWHPEGDVYVHTCMVVDRAAEIARADGLNDEDRVVFLFAALCHDLGKPETTTRDEEGGRIRSIGHERVGARLTRAWLDSLCLGDRRVRAIEALVEHHLAPAQFVGQGAGAGAYRRLARKLAAAGVTVDALERVARADALGRTTEEAKRCEFKAGAAFLENAASADVRDGPREDVVVAALLMERGIEPGPLMGRILRRCREIQDETGLTDAVAILDLALAEPDAD